MCLMVYLGSDAPVDGWSDVPLGEVGLEVEVANRPVALAGKVYVYRLADRLSAGWNCSCIFYHFDLGDSDTPNAETLSAFARLAEIVHGAAASGAKPILYACWAGEEGNPPGVAWALAPHHIVPEANIFTNPDVANGPRKTVLVRVDRSIEEPNRDVL